MVQPVPAYAISPLGVPHCVISFLTAWHRLRSGVYCPVASLYYRGNTIWLSFRAPDGKWKRKSTGYRKDNGGDRRAAKRLADKQTLQERLSCPVAHQGSWDFAPSYIAQRWGKANGSNTPATYHRRWHALESWLKAIGRFGPVNVTRADCLGYPAWRIAHGGSKNTAVYELKLLSELFDEAIRRGYCDANPASKLRIERDSPSERRIWTDDELDRVARALEAADRFGWMRVTYLLGRWQAARIGSCAIPLDDIDLERGVIHYAQPKGGRDRAYSQPIDKHLLPKLAEIVEYRRSIGATTLCDLPVLRGLHWRTFLNSLSILGTSHHGLRRTWITKAAIAGIPESAACKFTNHSSVDIHRLYLRYSTSDLASMLERL